MHALWQMCPCDLTPILSLTHSQTRHCLCVIRKTLIKWNNCSRPLNECCNIFLHRQHWCRLLFVVMNALVSTDGLFLSTRQKEINTFVVWVKDGLSSWFNRPDLCLFLTIMKSSDFVPFQTVTWNGMTWNKEKSKHRNRTVLSTFRIQTSSSCEY